MESALEHLIAAVDEGNFKTVRRLIEEGECLKDPGFSTYPFFNDWTDLAMVQFLAEAGADIDAIDQEGEWALRNAAGKGDMAAVSYLLSAGANPHLQNSNGSAIHSAVCSNKIEVVRLLLEAGADINAQDGDKWTCLWWVRSLEMAAFLLNHGADPSIPAWEFTGEPGPFPEDFESIPNPARDLMRAHRLKSESSGSH